MTKIGARPLRFGTTLLEWVTVRIFSTVVGLVAAGAGELAGQTSGGVSSVDPDVTKTLRRPARPSRLRAASEALLVNVFVNRADAWAFGLDWAAVGPSDWSRNLRLGWEWDENAFGANMFSHPYHGGLYFNAGRSNGLGFWESAPLAFLGSWSWEYFGETYRPSLNDFFMTSFGGIALGEVFHRIGASIRDNRAGGSARTWREIAALPFDPIGGFKRLLRGDWTKRDRNPAEHDPESFVFRLGAGGRFVADSGFVDRDDNYSGSPTLEVELDYGDPFLTEHRAPFDVFTVRGRVSPGGEGLNLLQASGRLFAMDFSEQTSRHMRGFAVNQRFDFLNNPAHRFGAQSLEFGVYSRWRFGARSAIRTHFFGDVIFLGAMEAPFAGTGEREYDFGPGAGTRVEIAYEQNGLTFLTILGRTEYVHSVSGASADHNMSFGAIELTLPLAFKLGLAGRLRYYNRRSRYSDRPDERREFSEVAVLVVWTGFQLPGFDG